MQNLRLFVPNSGINGITDVSADNRKFMSGMTEWYPLKRHKPTEAVAKTRHGDAKSKSRTHCKQRVAMLRTAYSDAASII